MADGQVDVRQYRDGHMEIVYRDSVGFLDFEQAPKSIDSPPNRKLGPIHGFATAISVKTIRRSQ